MVLPLSRSEPHQNVVTDCKTLMAAETVGQNVYVVHGAQIKPQLLTDLRYRQYFCWEWVVKNSTTHYTMRIRATPAWTQYSNFKPSIKDIVSSRKTHYWHSSLEVPS